MGSERRRWTRKSWSEPRESSLKVATRVRIPLGLQANILVRARKAWRPAGLFGVPLDKDAYIFSDAAEGDLPWRPDSTSRRSDFGAARTPLKCTEAQRLFGSIVT